LVQVFQFLQRRRFTNVFESASSPVAIANIAWQSLKGRPTKLKYTRCKTLSARSVWCAVAQQEWGIDPARVGILGFSAGGEIAALAATHYDAGNESATDPVERQKSRPDFQILIYPGTARISR
jgi:dienelactone hydrolase